MRQFTEKLKEVAISVVPITMIVLILHFTITPLSSETLTKFIIGAIMIIVGLGLFQLGADIGVIPMGQRVGIAMSKSRKIWMIVLFGFLIGFGVTIAEPDLQVLANQVSAVSNGEITKYMLLIVVSIGVGFFVVCGLLRTVFRVPLRTILLISYLLVFLMGTLTAPKFLAVSFDSGGVTTGPMTVPFILALGVGVASVRGGKSAEDDSFGLVALASVGPILAMLVLGVIYR